MSIDFSRVVKLLRRNVLVNGKRIYILLVPVVAILLFATFVTLDNVDRPMGDEPPFFVIWYGIFLLGFGFVATCHILPEMTSSDGRQNFLTLPASNADKWLSTWLLTGPIFLIGFTVFFTLLTSLLNGIAVWQEFEPYIGLWEETKPVFNLMLIYLLVVQPLGMIGAITFNSWAYIKTNGVLMLVSFFFFIWTVFSIRLIYHDHFSGFFTPTQNINANPFENALFGEGSLTALSILTTVILLAVSYFKFNEKQV